MLKQIFQSAPLQFPPTPPGGFAVIDGPTMNGLFVVPSTATTFSPDAIVLAANWFTGFGHFPTTFSQSVMWDSLSGAYLGVASGVATYLFGASGGIIQSRNGYFWLNRLFTGLLGGQAGLVALSGNEYGGFIPSLFGPFTSFACPALDDYNNLLLDGRGSTLVVLDISNGVSSGWSNVPTKYTLYMPWTICQITLQQRNLAYVLCTNRVLLLIDYVQGQVLGAVKIPPNPYGNALNSGSVNIAWDGRTSRLLIIEFNRPVSTMSVRGYYPAPIATYMTKPVLLDDPGQGNGVRAIVQVVGDSGEGVGGNAVQWTIGGSATPSSVPVTDQLGRSTINLVCGSPGSVNMNCQVVVP